MELQVYVLGYMPQKSISKNWDTARLMGPYKSYLPHPLHLYAKHTHIYKDRINVCSQPKGGNSLRNKLNLKLHLSSRQMTYFCFALFTDCRASISHTMLQDYHSKY